MLQNNNFDVVISKEKKGGEAGSNVQNLISNSNLKEFAFSDVLAMTPISSNCCVCGCWLMMADIKKYVLQNNMRREKREQ